MSQWNAKQTLNMYSVAGCALLPSNWMGQYVSVEN